MQSVRIAVGGGIPDESYDDSTWEGGGNTMEMEHPGCGGWASDFQDDLPSKGRPAELPSGGMPGPSGEEDGNAGALLSTECPQHRGYSGAGKLPPSKVRLMQHAGPPTGPKEQTPGHGTVCQGGGAEEMTARGSGDEGELGAGLRGIRRTDTECFGI